MKYNIKKTNLSFDKLMPWVVLLLVIFLIVIPVTMLVFASFRGPVGALPIQTRAYFTFDHYIDVIFSEESIFRILSAIRHR